MEPDYLEVFVTGRVCLFGEHSDWAGGHRGSNPAIVPGCCLVVGTNHGMHARVRRLDVPVLRLTSTDEAGGKTGPVEFPMDPKVLLEEARTGGFWAYACGTAHKIAVEFEVGGIEVDNYLTTLPLKKGLSSSAAICVMVARAFSSAYGLRLSVRGEMEHAYQGEKLTPSMCGRMDQACAYGRRPVSMTFDGDHLDVEPLQVGGPIHLVVVDLRAKKDTVRILSELNAAYPTSRNEPHEALHQLLGPINSEITGLAREALAAGDARALGELMARAQGEFDRCAAPLCPDQLQAPVLHGLLSHGSLQEHIWGGKGVGAGGDGSAQLVCRSQAGQAAAVAILEGELGMHALDLTIGGHGVDESTSTTSLAAMA